MKCYSGDQIKKSEIGGRVASMGGRRYAYRILVARTRCRREGSKKRIFWEWDGETWTGVIWLNIETGDGRL
jgi:hypothetical protein